MFDDPILDGAFDPLPREVDEACIRYVTAHCAQPADILEALGVRA